LFGGGGIVEGSGWGTWNYTEIDEQGNILSHDPDAKDASGNYDDRIVMIRDGEKYDVGYENPEGNFTDGAIDEGDLWSCRNINLYGRRKSAGTPWMDVAEREIGVKAIAGPQHNLRILEYHATTTLNVKNDETAWCSSSMNWVFLNTGIAGTNSARAADWLNWGQNLGKIPAYGSIGLVSNGKVGVKHVGLVENIHGIYIDLLGGNQSGQFKITRNYYKISDFVRFVYPIGYTPDFNKNNKNKP
jgi:uncharacterized protein (TIGR02594 family)